MTEDRADRDVTLAFDLIRSAATLLSAFPFAEAAASLRQQEDRVWFLDPITAQRIDRKDLERKLRLLDAAAAFAKVYREVGNDVLAEHGGPPESGRG